MERLIGNEIIISIYDSAWNWTILRIENGRTHKASAKDEILDTIEQQIYDSELLMWRVDAITTEVILKKLQENGYNKITI